MIHGSAQRRWVTAGVLLCIVLGLAHALYYWPEVIDDAYITFRYARNLAHGQGFAFNPGGERVEGASSLSWLLLSTAAIRVGVHDVLTASKLAGLALHAVLILGAWLLVGGAEERARPAALLAPLLFALNPFAAYHAVTGLETPLAAALLLAAGGALAGLKERPRAALTTLVLSLLLLLLTRPEAFGYAAALLAGGGIVHRRDPAARRRLAWAALALAAGCVTLAAWRWMAFGQLLPNTVAAKAAGPSGSETPWAGVHYVLRFCQSQYLPADAFVYLGAAAALVRWGGARDALLAVPVFAATVFAVGVRGDWMHSFRFMVPAVPFLCVLLARAAFAVERRWVVPGAAPPQRWLVAAAALALALFALQGVALDMARVSEHTFGRTWKTPLWLARIPQRLAEGYPARLAGVTRWLLENVAPGQVVATGDIGFPAWTADAPVVDLAGLTDAALARIVPAGDARAYGAYLRRRAPDLLVLRLEGGRPSAVYDALTLQSGILADYALADSVETYGREARALIYRRRGAAGGIAPDSVLARYERARRWNPRVAALGLWEEEYRRHARGEEPLAAAAGARRGAACACAPRSAGRAGAKPLDMRGGPSLASKLFSRLGLSRGA